MLILPAIDIIGGKVVRLTCGDYGSVKEYSSSPERVADGFIEAGATWLHVVDLDGAKSGKADNAAVIGALAKKINIEVGGGIRTEAQIDSYLSRGVSRVILGTAAVKDFGFAEKAAEKYPFKIAVGVDEINGFVAVSGWREVTDIDAFSFCKRLCEAGIENVIYTDITKDGGLSGTNIGVYKKLSGIAGLKITASGGITGIEEIKQLKDIGVYGAILGKALYEGKLDLKTAIAAAEN